MRIGIYLVPLMSQRTGRESAARGLLEALARLDAANDYYLFVSPQNRPLFRRPESNFHTVVARLPSLLSRRLWQLAHLYLAAWAERLDIIHLPEAPVPLFFSGRAAVNIYDISPLLFPSFFEAKGRIYYQKAITFGVQHATRIIACSENTRSDLIQRLSVDPDKVRVVPLAVDTQFHANGHAESSEAVRRKYGLPERFILNVGTLEPRKNLARLITSYRLLQDGGLQHGLVIAGGRGWLYDDILRAGQSDGLGQHIIFTGYVEEQDLPALYRAADVFVYPSLYEGFGLPVLEAMACGVPVVCSNRSALPEVAGDAALLVDPDDESAIAAALGRALHDSALRREMIDKGLARARQFSWERTAEQTLSVYQEICGSTA